MPPRTRAASSTTTPPAEATPPADAAAAASPVTDAPELEASRDAIPAAAAVVGELIDPAARARHAFGPEGGVPPSAFFAVPGRHPEPAPVAAAPAPTVTVIAAPPPPTVEPARPNAPPPGSYPAGSHVAVPGAAVASNMPRGPAVAVPASARPRTPFAAPAVPVSALSAQIINGVHVAAASYDQLVSTPDGPRIRTVAGDLVVPPAAAASGATLPTTQGRTADGAALPSGVTEAPPAAALAASPEAAAVAPAVPAGHEADPRALLARHAAELDNAVQNGAMTVQRYALALPDDHPARPGLLEAAAKLRASSGEVLGAVSKHAQ
jgi:translation initiation factor IF-2